MEYVIGTRVYVQRMDMLGTIVSGPYPFLEHVLYGVQLPTGRVMNLNSGLLTVKA